MVFMCMLSVPHLWLEPVEDKRGCQILLNWSYRGCEPPCVYWKLNLGH